MNTLFMATRITFSELMVINSLVIVAIICVLEKGWGVNYERDKQIVYEKIELVKPENYDLLLADLRQRTGLPGQTLSGATVSIFCVTPRSSPSTTTIHNRRRWMSKRKLSPTVPFSHDYPQKRRFAMDGHSWTQKSTALMFVCLLIGVSAIGSGRTFAHPDPVPNRPPQSTLQISEIMYNPPDGNVYEFVELYNAGAQKFDLDNVRFSAGIDFTFPNDTSLPTGTYLVLASDVSAFSTKYGFAPFGAFAGQLANNGERLTLETSDETELVSVRYDDEVPWPLTADGDGFSLVLHAPDDLGADPDLGENWQASSVAGGSPGAADGADAIPAVLVNEVLPHTDLPLVDAVELYNPSGRAADVGNWFITDDRTDPAQYQIPDGTLIAPYGYLYFTKDQLGFAFNELGEDAFLFSADAGGDLTGYSHGFSFGPSTNGVSFGRYITSTGAEHFTAQKNPTLGDVNAGPLVGPIVISAIHYMSA